MSQTFTLSPGKLDFAGLKILLNESTFLKLDPTCFNAIHAAAKTVNEIISAGKTVYGINTGFGSLANVQINATDLQALQRNLILSHAAGTGELLSDQTVRLIWALKINS